MSNLPDGHGNSWQESAEVGRSDLIEGAKQHALELLVTELTKERDDYRDYAKRLAKDLACCVESEGDLADKLAESEKKVETLKERNREAKLIERNINSLHHFHPEPDQTTYQEHVLGKCSCGVKR